MSEADFDVFGRLRAKGLPHWSDPGHRQPGEINTHEGGRGVYFDDPSGHNLEVMAPLLSLTS